MNDVYGQCSRCGGSLTTDHVCPDQFQSVLAKKAASLNEALKDQPISDLVAESIEEILLDYNRKCQADKLHSGFAKPLSKEIIALVEPVIRAKLLDQAIEIVLAEPETIQTSSSYRMGYARCARDKAELLRVLNKP